ncbi:MAG: hypothetical protein JXR53_07245 [Bacteroidales bacterium]|nr:hypothetical protein [Bacteroidales bacterium]
MKKITHHLLIILSVFLVAFSSCKKDDGKKIPPTLKVTFSNGSELSDTAAQAGQSIIIQVEGIAGSENITYFSLLSNGEHVLDSGLNSESFVSQRVIVKSTDSLEKYTILIRDKNFQETRLDFNISLLPTLVYGNIRTLTFELGAQSNTTLGSFYDLFANQVYTLSEAYNNQGSVQMLYFYDPSEESTIASPNANIDSTIFGGTYQLPNWATRNEIRYVLLTITQQDFDQCQNDSLIIANLFQYDTGKRKAKYLTPGDIYEFSHQGRYGIFYVNAVSGTNTGTINVTIKIQE